MIEYIKENITPSLFMTLCVGLVMSGFMYRDILHELEMTNETNYRQDLENASIRKEIKEHNDFVRSTGEDIAVIKILLEELGKSINKHDSK